MHIKSQSAVEFVMLVSFMLFVIIGFFSITSSNMLQAREEANRQIAEDIANFAYQELEITKSVNDGYKRKFTIPQTVNGVNYSINITDNIELAVNYLGYEHLKFLPSNVTGNIVKGDNFIRKINGIIYIN